ncbi:MAG: phage terminase large subunit [Rhizobiaceae bacterium]|nr:phage terminase large subunit [Rhizobiaceae bacterium]
MTADLYEPHDLIAELCRCELYFFVQKVFETLYPSEKFLDSEYLEAMCRSAQVAVEAEHGRLLVNLPPRYFKSTVISVALPAFFLGHNPGKDVLVATHSAEFARLHHNQFRKVLEIGWYKGLFPDTRIDTRNNRADEIRLARGGGRKSISVGGSAMGYGADLLIVDDLMTFQDTVSERERQSAIDFFENELFRSLNDKKRSSIIVIQQRLHEYDLTGYLLDKGGYGHLNLPVVSVKDEEKFALYDDREYVRRKGDLLAPERDDPETVSKIRAEMTATAFQAQYMQNPMPGGSGQFNFDGIATTELPPSREDCHCVIQSWDPAFTIGPNSAYSVCTTWGRIEKKWYLLDVVRERREFPDLLQKVIAEFKRWRADGAIVEGGGSGQQIVQQVRHDYKMHKIWVKNVGQSGKEARLIEQSARLLSSNYVIPTNTSWYEELRNEFRWFPNGRYADQVDSVTQFVEWAHSNMGRGRTGMSRAAEIRAQRKLRR